MIPGMPENPRSAGMAKVHLEKVERAAMRLAEAREELRVSIMLARASGETLEDIGRSPGLTRQRVQQIVAESEGR